MSARVGGPTLPRFRFARFEILGEPAVAQIATRKMSG